MTLGIILMTLEACWEHFWMIFQCLDPIGHQNEPKGTPKVALGKPEWIQGVQNEVILGTKSDPKSIKNRFGTH